MAVTPAEAWCAALRAAVDVRERRVRLVTVRVPGFHPVTAATLEDAVATLSRTVAAWCAGGATHGPTGASLAPARAALDALDAPGSVDAVPGGTVAPDLPVAGVAGRVLRRGRPRDGGAGPPASPAPRAQSAAARRRRGAAGAAAGA